ncbi:MBL fold metallo-hydrolase [Candidatus Epulonipiscium fishelsonii]|uniref:MBL fold metallo-hydrolase n=1 Tax=Candidatus Epulonipiscium fishelsonii TaxID=77094 RepID=A0ACC8XBT0_9FIRM|nr:MBL fold metallo-hydrolase [Epulopiscium sp. SCG-B05WGA-EpuloA1]ONI40037.1 MBL fold metallo-hydrolase [Epulopiscium sp. SCG-B11WGA-EpuloA1]
MVLKDKKTRIIFHNGILKIGGTIIEVAYEDSHIFFDFGSEYNPTGPAQPTTLQGLLDEKLVPYIDNIFDPSIKLEGYTSKPDGFEHVAVFLSHVHLDHSKIVNYLNPAVQLYSLDGTKSLLETLNINNDFLLPLEVEQESNTREITGVREYEEIQVGKIKVTVMPVDHDAYGACGLLIQTPDLKIAYSGDIRLHGYREEASLKFCEASKDCDVLLIEGVSVSFQEVDDEPNPNDISNESKLIEKINEIVEQNPDKQITFNYYISNIERIMKIIETNPRKVVLSAYYAYVLKDATGYDAYYYQNDNVDYKLDINKKIDYNVLLDDTHVYFWQLITGDDVAKLKQGGIYIHSNAIPLGEFDPRFEPFIKSFEEHNIKFERLSCSGHAYPKDLIKIINLISPKLLVPVHSLRPEKLFNENGDVFLPEKGQQI